MKELKKNPLPIPAKPLPFDAKRLKVIEDRLDRIDKILDNLIEQLAEKESSHYLNPKYL